jgi:O-antigen/teichoic acid export membrane protein
MLKAVIIKYKSNILNILLRLVSMISRFVLLLYIAKYFTAYDLGVYGIFVITISYSLYLVGLEFHRYSQRILLGKDYSLWKQIIKNQMIFYLISYIFFFPLLFLIFFYNLLSKEFIVYFYLILLLEHITQEISRLLVTMKKPLEANIMTFVKVGLWVYIVTAIMYSNKNLNKLETIWITWIIGDVLSLFVGYFFTKELKWKEIMRSKIDIVLLKKGFLVSLPFIVVILANRGIFTLDRYSINYYFGKDLVGVYTFYIGIANAIQTFIDAGVIMYLYPKMIEAFNKKDFKNYIKYKKEMLRGIVIMFIIIVLFIYLFIDYVLIYINKDLFFKNINVLWVLCLSGFLMSIGIVYDHSLYAKEKDKVLMNNSLFTIIIFLICLFFLNNLFIELGILNVALSMTFAFSFSLFYKYYHDNKESYA